MKSLTLDWAATVVGRMHAVGVTGIELAEEAGLSNTYLSAVLHAKKGNEKTRERIVCALERLEEEKQREQAESV